MAKSVDFRRATGLIDKSGSVLLTTHTKPDGDACGCVAALCEILTALGKKAQALMLTEVPQWYEFLFSEKAPVFGEDVTAEQILQGRLGEFDLILIVDADSYSQFGDFEQFLKQNNTQYGRRHKPVLVIDHHVTSDGVGDVQLLDSSAAATGLIVLDLIKHAGWAVTERMAEALFVAIATDTGWFQFSNTDSRVYAACAELTDAGAKPAHVYDKLYNNFSHGRFRLVLAMLATLELHFDGRFAVQHILQRDFERTGTTYADTENLINECHRIGTVKASALFAELCDGSIKCSLRSKGDIDVCKIAQEFGGGGHKSAAAAHLAGPLEHAKKLILQQAQGQLSQSEPP